MKPYKRKCTLYHLSEDNLDGVVMKPRIPLSRLDEEDAKHVRVCFSTSISGALRAINPSLLKYCPDFYVMCPVDYDKINVFVPSENEVPDVKDTREKWVRNKVKVECIGKIRAFYSNALSGGFLRFRWIE